MFILSPLHPLLSCSIYTTMFFFHVSTISTKSCKVTSTPKTSTVILIETSTLTTSTIADTTASAVTATAIALSISTVTPLEVSAEIRGKTVAKSCISYKLPPVNFKQALKYIRLGHVPDTDDSGDTES